MTMSERPLRLLFAGSPEIALFALEALLSARNAAWSVVGVLTNPDAPKGRGRALTPTPVAARAREAGIPVLTPVELRSDAREQVRNLTPDLLVVVAYGKIFGPRFLELFPAGGINLHPSLLPRHRGPSPLQAAILEGDEVTGVTIQYLAPEMDAGDIILQEQVPLPRSTTVAELHDDLGRRGAALITRAVQSIADGTVRARPQDHDRATYCRKIDRDAGTLSWRESALEIERRVRALTPWPGVRCRWGDRWLQFTDASAVETVDPPRPGATPGTVVGVDNRFGILIQTRDGLLAVRRLKLQARKELTFDSFLHGNPAFVGSHLE